MDTANQRSSPVVQEARSKYSRSFLNLAIYATFSQLVVILLATAVRAAQGSDTLQAPVRYAIQFGTMYALGLPLYLLISKNMEISPPKKQPLKVWHYFLLIPVLLCLMYTGNLIGMLFGWLVAVITGVDIQSTTIQQNIYGEYGYIMVLAAVFLAPVVEELLFRKVLIDRIRKFGDGKAVLLSGLFFGLFHGNFTQFFYTTLVGMLFAFVYVKTGKVLHTIILHMTANFIGGALPYLVNAQDVIDAVNDWDLSAVFSNIPFLIYMIVVLTLAFTGLILLLIFRKQFTFEEPQTALPEGTARYAVTANIGFWAMLVFAAYEFGAQIMR